MGGPSVHQRLRILESKLDFLLRSVSVTDATGAAVSLAMLYLQCVPPMARPPSTTWPPRSPAESPPPLVPERGSG